MQLWISCGPAVDQLWIRLIQCRSAVVLGLVHRVLPRPCMPRNERVASVQGDQFAEGAPSKCQAMRAAAEQAAGGEAAGKPVRRLFHGVHFHIVDDPALPSQSVQPFRSSCSACSACSAECQSRACWFLAPRALANSTCSGRTWHRLQAHGRRQADP